MGVLALGLQTLPSVCWVPMAILWFGMTETTMQFVVIMGTLWSVLIAVDNGVRNMPPLFVRAARTMGSRGLHTLVRVILPASLPYIVSGMKQGWAFAWRSLMAAEIFVPIATGDGLGLLTLSTISTRLSLAEKSSGTGMLLMRRNSKKSSTLTRLSPRPGS